MGPHMTMIFLSLAAASEATDFCAVDGVGCNPYGRLPTNPISPLCACSACASPFNGKQLFPAVMNGRCVCVPQGKCTAGCPSNCPKNAEGLPIYPRGTDARDLALIERDTSLMVASGATLRPLLPTSDSSMANSGLTPNEQLSRYGIGGWGGFGGGDGGGGDGGSGGGRSPSPATSLLLVCAPTEMRRSLN